jgi:hypothetical protein
MAQIPPMINSRTLPPAPGFQLMDIDSQRLIALTDAKPSEKSSFGFTSPDNVFVQDDPSMFPSSDNGPSRMLNAGRFDETGQSSYLPDNPQFSTSNSQSFSPPSHSFDQQELMQIIVAKDSEIEKMDRKIVELEQKISWLWEELFKSNKQISRCTTVANPDMSPSNSGKNKRKRTAPDYDYKQLLATQSLRHKTGEEGGMGFCMDNSLLSGSGPVLSTSATLFTTIDPDASGAIFIDPKAVGRDDPQSCKETFMSDNFEDLMNWTGQD